jgi:hypothetical protein
MTVKRDSAEAAQVSTRVLRFADALDIIIFLPVGAQEAPGIRQTPVGLVPPVVLDFIARLLIASSVFARIF